MPIIQSKSTMSAEEASAIVRGYCTFEGIDPNRYPHLDAKSVTPSTQFQWKIFHLEQGPRAHNTAFIQRAETTKSDTSIQVGVYNDSSKSDLSDLRPPDTLTEALSKTHHYEQTEKSNDCGFCSAFFVIHAIQYFERSLVPSLTTLPKPTSNPFEEKTRLIARMQSAFYANCEYLRLSHQIKLLPDSPLTSSADPRIQALREARSDCALTLPVPNQKSNGGVIADDDYQILVDFFYQKRANEKTALADHAFRDFASFYLSRDSVIYTSENCHIDYDDWFLYQNLFLYLLLNHFQQTCLLIKESPDALAIPRVLEQARKLDPECKFYEKQYYQNFARLLLPEQKMAEVAKAEALKSPAAASAAGTAASVAASIDTSPRALLGSQATASPVTTPVSASPPKAIDSPVAVAAVSVSAQDVPDSPRAADSPVAPENARPIAPAANASSKATETPPILPTAGAARELVSLKASAQSQNADIKSAEKHLTKAEFKSILDRYETSSCWHKLFCGLFSNDRSGTIRALRNLSTQETVSGEDIKNAIRSDQYNERRLKLFADKQQEKNGTSTDIVITQLRDTLELKK
jgi:hypothetical protein